MSDVAPKLVTGFSSANIERIYRGEPALTDGQLPLDVLSERQFEAFSYYADGLFHLEIAAAMGRLSTHTVANHIKNGNAQLGILKRSQIAGFFPLPAGHEAVRDKKLSDLLEVSPATLGILEAFSVGRRYEQIAAASRLSVHTVRGHVYDVNAIWETTKGELLPTRVANAIRARYVGAIQTDPEVQIDTRRLTLPVLAKMEPRIEQEFLKTESVTNHTAAAGAS